MYNRFLFMCFSNTLYVVVKKILFLFYGVVVSALFTQLAQFVLNIVSMSVMQVSLYARN